MKIKDYLKMPYRLNKQIIRNRHDMERWEAMAYSITKDTVQPHYNPNRATSAPYERCIEMVETLRSAIKDQEEHLEEIKTSVLSDILILDKPELVTILKMRYIDFETWPVISRELNYSESYTYKMHGRALEELNAILKKDSTRIV